MHACRTCNTIARKILPSVMLISDLAFMRGRFLHYTLGQQQIFEGRQGQGRRLATVSLALLNLIPASLTHQASLQPTQLHPPHNIKSLMAA